MKRIYFFLTLLLCATTGISSAQVVINEIYGGGGNTGATYKNDFIELYNNGNAAVSLAGWSVQYASATGSSWSSTNLSGTISAHGFYLIQGAAGTGGTTSLPTPDATGTINLSGTAGKVILCNTTAVQTGTSPTGAQIIDLAGFGTTANYYEGSGATPAPSNINSVQRTPVGQDTNNNSTDFTAGAPSPSNSSIVTGGAAIVVTPASLNGFSTATGTASSAQTVTAGGTGLTDNITITPAIPYEVSVDGGSTYTSSTVMLVQSGGTVASTTVGIRIAATASVGTANASVSFSATGVATQSVSLSGTVTGTGPAPVVTVDASGINSFTTTTPDASAVQFFTVSGSDIAGGGITLAPSGPYEISADGGITFSSSPATVLLNQSGGVVDATAIQVRITANTPAGAANGTILISSTGAADQQVTLTGVSLGVSANVVINQVYGGGGNSGSTYKSDFIELYNNESTPVNLAGWSVQYVSATGSSWTANALSGTVPAHGFFLIKESTGTGGTVNLPAPDLTGTLALSGTTGKVIISNSIVAQNVANPTDATIIDKVGYGPTANGYETSPAPVLDNTTSVRRVTDGVDNNNNSTDFSVGAPLPRNSTYTTAAPMIFSLTPANGATGIPVPSILSITFDKEIIKGTGTITVYENGVAGTPLDVNDAGIVISNNTTVSIPATLSSGKSYYVLLSAGAFTDVYGNVFAGITSSTTWAFSIYDYSTATAIPVTFDFQQCTGNGLLPNGFTQYSTTGAQVWDCTSFGRDPAAPAGTAAFPNAVQVNGYANGINNLNYDWLISPKLDLTGTTYPLLSFWSRNAFDGDPLVLKISTDYSGSGDPSLATWTDLNGKFPSKGSDTWTLSNGINLSAYKQSSVYLAYVYTSTTDDGSRWTLDDISLINSATPPPPSLTLSASNLEFGYTATGNNSTKTITVTGNDLVGDVLLTATGDFLLSTDGTNFSSTATITQALANNVPQTLYVRFAPATDNIQYNETISITISDSTGVVMLKGNSIDPASTLNVVNWNLNWFATPDPTLGPVNKSLQQDNVAVVLKSIPADLFVLQEVVNRHSLDSIVNTMPGYAYIINDYGSYSNPNEPTADPLTEVQKLAFVYNTTKFSNIHTDSLLSKGVTSAADVSNKYYNAFASGRFPYMMSADVTLSDNNGGFITHPMRFINIHAKANTAPVLTAYQRRLVAATGLDSLIKADYINDNVVILGDFNDDLNQTITAGQVPATSSYSPFTIDDASLYIFPTKPLSPAGQHSDVNYTSVIDNVIATAAAAKYYLPASATVLSDVANLVTKYGTTTTDHYPVFTQYSFSTLAALPVKLVSFKAVRQNQQVLVSWTTSQEVNSRLFDVERSIDGHSYSKIGTVAAMGTSNVKTDYNLVDKQPVPGINYYRLKQVDKDGKTVYSAIIKVNFTSVPDIRIAPNPASTYLYISLENINSNVKLQMIDAGGKLVKQQQITPGTANKTISLSGMAKGLYMVKLISGDNITIQKVVVQ